MENENTNDPASKTPLPVPLINPPETAPQIVAVPTPAPTPNTTPAPAPLPAPVPAPASTPAPQAKDMQADIARILSGAPLPERPLAPPSEPQKKYDTSLGAIPDVAKPDTEKLATPPAPPKTDLGSLHTLKDDLQHVVQENKISYVRAVALEEEKRHQTDARIEEPVRKSARARSSLFLAATLVIVGLFALIGAFVVMQQRSTPQSAFQTGSILFAEQAVPFSIENESPGDILRTLASTRQSTSLTLGAILQIIPVSTVKDQDGNPQSVPVSFVTFLRSLETRAPEELMRAFGEEFFFGMHSSDENAPIIVVPIVSYERAFAAMLEWEKFMNADLAPLFTPLSPQAETSEGLLERKFEDVVMRNYDVRALKDDAGVIQMYYSFPTRNILIIAESPYSFTEVLSRLRADRRL